MKKKHLLLIAFIVALITLSFLREFIFININAHRWYMRHENEFSHLPAVLSFLKSLSHRQLYWLKWALTVFFSLLFLILSCSIVKLIFAEKKFIRITIYSYIVLFLVSLICYAAGWVFNNMEQGYIVARFFMGMLQSPFVLMALIPAFLGNFMDRH